MRQYKQHMTRVVLHISRVAIVRQQVDVRCKRSSRRAHFAKIVFIKIINKVNSLLGFLITMSAIKHSFRKLEQYKTGNI